MAADSVNTVSLTSVVLIPSVALAAGLSFKASSRWPNVDRRMATTARYRTANTALRNTSRARWVPTPGTSRASTATEPVPKMLILADPISKSRRPKIHWSSSMAKAAVASAR
jgi:hypothetical protein